MSKIRLKFKKEKTSAEVAIATLMERLGINKENIWDAAWYNSTLYNRPTGPRIWEYGYSSESYGSRTLNKIGEFKTNKELTPDEIKPLIEKLKEVKEELIKAGILSVTLEFDLD